MRGALPAALLLALAWSEAAAARRNPREELWSDRRYAEEEIKASRQLREIQERVDRGDLPKVQFEFDSAKVQPESFITLNLIADLLLKKPNLKLRIAAHTCTIGTAEYNLKLSERRAKAVKEYLVKQGATPPAIRYKGWGYSQPIADNSTEEGREKNRRVEFQIVTRDWDSVY